MPYLQSLPERKNDKRLKKLRDLFAEAARKCERDVDADELIEQVHSAARSVMGGDEEAEELGPDELLEESPMGGYAMSFDRSRKLTQEQKDRRDIRKTAIAMKLRR